MKINHITTTLNGGAGIAAGRLCQGLQALAVEAPLYSSMEIMRCDRFYQQLLRHVWNYIHLAPLRNIDAQDCELLSPCRCFVSQSYDWIMECDIINLHWIAHLIDWPTFFSHPGLPKLVWTLHDMNPFLGLAHYLHDADKLNQSLGGAKALGDPARSDYDHKTWLVKKRIIDHLPDNQLTVVCPSKWLAGLARNSFLRRFSIEVIPYGLDTMVFKPIERTATLDVLQIPESRKKIILFVADSLSNRRKGMDVLIDALQQLENKDEYLLLTMGKALSEAIPQLEVVSLGYISDDRLKACVYSAADLFVIPSREDNLPNTVLESLACGTPVLGNNVGGIPDMVRPGVNGDLFESGHSRQLAQKIRTWFERADLGEISRNCREIAVREYSSPIQAARYQNLYDEILATNL